jgi:hypothetical protein
VSANEPTHDWEAVDRFVRSRAESQGDTFGWMHAERPSGPCAIILTSSSADVASFPTVIGGVPIEIRRVSEPERHVC